jgi:hypothetical protein
MLKRENGYAYAVDANGEILGFRKDFCSEPLVNEIKCGNRIDRVSTIAPAARIPQPLRGFRRLSSGTRFLKDARQRTPARYTLHRTTR